MTFRQLSVFLFVLFIFPLKAQEIVGKGNPIENSLLWKIQRPGQKKSAYLFGTMHLIEEAYFFFPDKLEKLIKNTSVLVLELPGLPNPVEVQKLIELKEGNVFDFFNDQQQDSLFSWAKDELKLNETSFRAAFGKYKPFALVQLAVQLQFMGKTRSYEMELEELARTYQKEIVGLETIEQQLQFFDKLTKEQQTEMVMETVRNPKKSIEETQAMQQLYRRQNIDSLYLLINSDGGIISTQQEDFLDKRNKAWVPKIEAIIEEKEAFIAVGAGHLGGSNGLIRLLRSNRYQLTPLFID